SVNRLLSYLSTHSFPTRRSSDLRKRYPIHGNHRNHHCKIFHSVQRYVSESSLNLSPYFSSVHISDRKQVWHLLTVRLSERSSMLCPVRANWLLYEVYPLPKKILDSAL